MHVVGEVLNEFLSFVGNSASGLDFLGDGFEFSLSWDFTSHQKPKEGFWEGFMTSGSLLKVLDQIRDGVSSEFDTLSGFRWRLKVK